MQDLEINKTARNIRDVIRYIKRFHNAIAVIYIDDEVLDTPLFSSHLRDISLIHQAGLKVVVVPGARKRIDQILNNFNKKWEFRDGVRITTEDAIPQIKMVSLRYFKYCNDRSCFAPNHRHNWKLGESACKRHY